HGQRLFPEHAIKDQDIAASNTLNLISYDSAQHHRITASLHYWKGATPFAAQASGYSGITT
ncbi:hypothetical protein OAN83_03605, partial [Alphaproteobacteria bacterium]|nr:hypothetical protein [Alphaproteobacteria bacterium]